MADAQRFILHYMTDSLWGAKTANNIAKMGMAKALSRQDQIERLYFYTLTDNKDKIMHFRLAGFSEKLRVKPLVFASYKDRTLYGRNPRSLCYDLFYASPIMVLRAFSLALGLKKREKVFIRGLESLVGFYFGSLVSKAGYAFERHNYSFGRLRMVDFFFRKMVKRAKFVVTISEYTKQHWVNNGIPENKIIVLPGGLDMEDFDRVTENKEQLRNILSLPNDKRIILYAGALYENRGIEELLYSAARYSDYVFLFLGGTSEHIERYKCYIKSMFGRHLPNVVFKGYVEHGEVAQYLKASDILVAPYSSRVKTVDHMNPIKVMEYLASCVPVILSDLPSTKAMVTEDEATFFKADSEDDLCEKIKWVFENYEPAKSKAMKAYKKASNLTWEKRAVRIVGLLQN